MLLSKFVRGSFLRIHQKCRDCGAATTWDSQPFINEFPEGNLLMSAAILFNGCFPEQTLRVFRTIGCASISRTSYFRHQKKFLNPAIFQLWDMNQQSYFAQLAKEGKPLVLGGDGRADSPGHSAKFGSYSLVELNHNNIVLDICLVQVCKVSIYNYYCNCRVMRCLVAITWNWKG